MIPSGGADGIGLFMGKGNRPQASYATGSNNAEKASYTDVLPGSEEAPEVSLVVGKIIWSASPGLDTLEIYVPGEDLALPATPTSTISVDLDQSTFDRITFGHKFDSGFGRDPQFDEIRVGATYDEVIGGNPDPNAPFVDAGADMISWSGQAVPMDTNVVEALGSDWTNLTYLWTAVPDDGVVFDPNEFVEAPTVTITKPTDNPSVVTMTLVVNDEDNPPEKAVQDSMTIHVYDDACLAAKGLGSVEFDRTDIDENCITNFKDFALMAETWLEDYALTEPITK